MSGDQIFHIRIAQSTCNGKHSIDAIVKDEPASTCDTLPFVLVTALVVIGQPKGFTVAAKNDSSIADIGGIENSLTGRCGCELTFIPSRI